MSGSGRSRGPSPPAAVVSGTTLHYWRMDWTSIEYKREEKTEGKDRGGKNKSLLRSCHRK